MGRGGGEGQRGKGVVQQGQELKGWGKRWGVAVREEAGRGIDIGGGGLNSLKSEPSLIT